MGDTHVSRCGGAAAICIQRHQTRDIRAGMVQRNRSTLGPNSGVATRDNRSASVRHSTARDYLNLSASIRLRDWTEIQTINVIQRDRSRRYLDGIKVV